MSRTARDLTWWERILWGVGPSVIRAFGRVTWRLEIETEQNLPAPPFVVAANHHSFIDAVLIGAVLATKIRFLALQDLFGHHRSLDLALRAFDVIPLRRNTVPLGPIKEALTQLEAGGAVGLFPEGTRHRDFDPGEAKDGAAWLAAHTGVPLVPVALSGTGQVFGLDNRVRPGRVRIVVGPSLQHTGTRRPDVERLTTRWGEWISTTLGRISQSSS